MKSNKDSADCAITQLRPLGTEERLHIFVYEEKLLGTSAVAQDI